MAYNKISNYKKDKDIKYLAKDYQTIKNDLIEWTKIYFPDKWSDFSEGNPGMMFLEMAAYVGDVLSFYLDTQVQEAFLDAFEMTFKNIDYATLKASSTLLEKVANEK